MKKIIRNFLALFGLKLSKLSSLKKDWREDPFEVKKSILGKSSTQLVIFDVGAYIGNVALHYRSLFANSIIYCFEPFQSSYSKLKEQVTPHENIFHYNVGMSNYCGKSSFHSNKFAPTNSLLATHSKGSETWETDRLDTQEIISIDIITLDSFIEEHSIQNIDLLKLDVQGVEYQVLQGAENALRSGKIKMIYTEILTMPAYEGQNYLDEILQLLRKYNYKLINFYNLSLTNLGELRQVDALFIKE